MENRTKRSPQTAAISDDPRIVSPEIKVVYPVEMEVRTDTKPPVADTSQMVETNQTEVPKEETPHVCTISYQEALKQHLVAAIGSAILLLLIGYLIGKK